MQLHDVGPRSKNAEAFLNFYNGGFFMADKIAVLIPCYNESKSVGKVVQDMKGCASGSYDLCI